MVKNDELLVRIHMKNAIEEIYYDDFIDFYKDMLPRGKLFSPSKRIFRGQSSKSYTLLPSALREDRLKELISASRYIRYDVQLTIKKQLELEIKSLTNFYKLAHANGLNIPKIDYISSRYDDPFSYDFILGTEDVVWPHPDFIELMAIAQHNGIPTRMLDWTYDYNVALYFAALSACKKLDDTTYKESDFITLWIIYITDFIAFNDSAPIKFVVSNYYENKNIHAQHGILSYCPVVYKKNHSKNSNATSVDRTPIEDILQNSKVELGDIKKIFIPAHNAPRLFTYLHHLGYTTSRLFPGYKGVADELRETRFLVAPWEIE